jgi:hypothetical protein
MVVRELPRSTLSSLRRNEHVTVEGVKTLARRMKAKPAFARLPNDDAGDVLSRPIDGVSFRHEISSAGGAAAAFPAFRLGLLMSCCDQQQQQRQWQGGAVSRRDALREMAVSETVIVRSSVIRRPRSLSWHLSV